MAGQLGVGTGGPAAWAAWAAKRAGRQGRVKYQLPAQPPAGVPPPLHDGMVSALTAMFVGAGLSAGTLDVQLMVSVMAARLAPSTWQSYSSVFGQFVSFCVSQGLPFLPATEAVGLLWLVHLAKKGTVQADTAGPYFSGVNTVHELLGFPKPCVGMPFDAFKRGWVRSQQVLVQEDSDSTILACPAAVALAWYRGLDGLSANNTLLKQVLFCVLAFRLFIRPASLLAIVNPVVICVDGKWTFRYKPEEYKTRKTTVGSLPVMSLDLTPFPLLREALQRYLRGLRGKALWGPGKVTTSQAAGWFTAVLAEFSPGVMGQLTLYSCRRGGASAARAAGVPLYLIELMGGWARGSVALRSRYFDMSVAADEAAMFWFEGMVLPGVVAPLYVAPFFQ